MVDRVILGVLCFIVGMIAGLFTSLLMVACGNLEEKRKEKDIHE